MNGIKHLSNGRCNTCTVQLAAIAYSRAFWFRLVREPLLLAMKIMARMKGIRAKDIDPPSRHCYRCPRFLKTALKDRSVFFNKAYVIINPWFDRIMHSIVTPEEIKQAKEFALLRTQKGEDYHD